MSGRYNSAPPTTKEFKTCVANAKPQSRCKKTDKVCSDKYLVHHAPGHVGEPEITPGITVRQALVIEADQMQARGAQVVDVDAVAHGTQAEVVGRTIRHAAAHTSPGHPHRETVVIMVAAVRTLRGWRAAE